MDKPSSGKKLCFRIVQTTSERYLFAKFR